MSNPTATRPWPQADAEPQTVAEVTAFFLRKGPKSKVPTAQVERKRLLELFCAEHGSLPLTACRPYHLQLWIDSIPSWAAAWTRDRVNKTVQRPFNWAKKLGLIDRNPFQGCSYPRGRQGRDMTPEEFQSLLRARVCKSKHGPRRPASRHFIRVLIFLRASGMRPVELRRLTWDMVREELHAIVQAEHKTAHVDGQARRIILNSVTVKMLAWLRKRAGKSPYVFLNSAGEPWSPRALTKQLAHYRRRAKLPADCKMYGTRHAFATGALVNGVDLMTLATLLGHRTVVTTQRYCHLANQVAHLRRAAELAIGRKGGAA